MDDELLEKLAIGMFTFGAAAVAFSGLSILQKRLEYWKLYKPLTYDIAIARMESLQEDVTPREDYVIEPGSERARIYNEWWESVMEENRRRQAETDAYGKAHPEAYEPYVPPQVPGEPEVTRKTGVRDVR